MTTELPKVTIISRVVTMGKNRMIIEVPKEYLEEMRPLLGKRVKVDVKEAI